FSAGVTGRDLTSAGSVGSVSHLTDQCPSSDPGGGSCNLGEFNFNLYSFVCVCACVYECECICVIVRAFVRACGRVCVHVRERERERERERGRERGALGKAKKSIFPWPL